MFKKLLATMSVMSLVAVASAGTISTSLAMVDTSEAGSLSDIAHDPAAWAAAGYVVVDLQVTIGGNDGDSWTTAGAAATLTGGTFWEHSVGSDTPPNPALFGAYGLLRYDSFYTTPEDWPNDPAIFGNTNIVTIDSQATTRSAEWYVTPAEPNVTTDGTYTIARYCFLPTRAWELCVEGDVFLQSSGGDPYDYSVCIPEPSGLALLGLGALALIRRR